MILKEESRDNKSENEIEEILSQGVAEVIDKDSLIKKLNSGKKLRIKYGIDATAPEIHLGHAVPIRKLRQFQDLDHTIVFLIGDMTAQIGDPSGRYKSREVLTAKEVQKNAQNYFAQAYKILDQEKTEVHCQSEWYGKMNLQDFIDLLSKVSANLILSHETFKIRLEKNMPLSMNELIYPILQGYDSVVLKADVEIGGQDQKFNLLMGRHIQRALGQNQQEVIMTKYLYGTDGKEKMSKSLGNYIAILDSPSEMFGKTMSIPDEQIVPYFELCTNISAKGLEVIKREYENSDNRRDLKAKLAKLIVETYHDLSAAEQAESEFDKVFKQKQIPSQVEELKINQTQLKLIDLLSQTKLIASASEGKRLISQGGVKIEGKIYSDPFEIIPIKKGIILQVGKRKFVRLN